MALFTANANPGLIAQSASDKARRVRDSLNDVQGFYAWISGQSDTDLESIGITAGDIGLMRSMAADLNALFLIYHGQDAPGTYTLPYPFINSSTGVIGPQ